MKILLVEDDDTIRATIRLLFQLRWPEAELISTHLGKTAVRLSREEDIEALILDLGLPDISGFEVLEQIRGFSQVPVVILTARKEQDDRDRSARLGADDYITKPFKNSELLERVQDLAMSSRTRCALS